MTFLAGFQTCIVVRITTKEKVAFSDGNKPKSKEQ